MRDERRKEERSKQGQTNNKAKQHSTPKAVSFPKKNELPQVGLEMLMRYAEERKKEASKVTHFLKHPLTCVIVSISSFSNCSSDFILPST